MIEQSMHRATVQKPWFLIRFPEKQYISTNTGLLWCQSGAGFRPSTVWLHFGVDEHPFATYFDVHQRYRVLIHCEQDPVGLFEVIHAGVGKQGWSCSCPVNSGWSFSLQNLFGRSCHGWGHELTRSHRESR